MESLGPLGYAYFSGVYIVAEVQGTGENKEIGKRKREREHKGRGEKIRKEPADMDNRTEHNGKAKKQRK